MPATPQLDGRPEVVVDVDVRDGLFSILLRNIGQRPALVVRTRFDKPFTGLGGRKAITTMRVFKGVAFMAPGKVFEQFVDPLAAYNFLVEIDGMTVAGFSGCSGLGAETAVIEYREGSDKGGVRKLPGLTKFSNLTLKRGLTTSRELWQWHRTVVTGRVERPACRIVVLDEEHTPVARYHLENAWPVKYEGPRLKATDNEIAIETLEIAHEGLELEA